MGVSKNRGIPKWMIWGHPYFRKHPYGSRIKKKNRSQLHTLNSVELVEAAGSLSFFSPENVTPFPLYEDGKRSFGPLKMFKRLLGSSNISQKASKSMKTRPSWWFQPI